MPVNQIKIVLDAMGGDFAPDNELQGAVEFMNNPQNHDVQIILTGDESLLKERIKSLNISRDFEIINCKDKVAMDDEPTDIIKRKRDSSLYRGIELVKDAKADAFVSSGNTGAVHSTSTLVLGRIAGVSRPTIGTFFPSVTDNPVLLLDVGANVDAKPSYIFQFAVMGSIYSSQILGIKNPKIGLLNIGEEETKGTNDVRETYKLLKDSPLNFIGNIEGRDIFSAHADVVVCDGFIGNIVLKFAESFLGILKSKIKSYSEESIIKKIKVGLMVPVLKDILQQFDYQKYGGVPLLGVNGAVIIGHGKSSPEAVKNMLVRAKEMVQKEVNKSIESTLKELIN
ncbi:MAG: phosphate acyltransferase PlsX [Candidatus Kapabacteria bacterium]|nr:phosphate acyltransferase PlsX [Candidatus Kapabacteria bacterium]